MPDKHQQYIRLLVSQGTMNTAAVDTAVNDLHASDRLAARMLPHHSDGVIYKIRLILHVQGYELRCVHQTSE